MSNAAAIAIRLAHLDVLRVPRGHCLACEWCPEFISLSRRVICEYCGCPPAKHKNLEVTKSKVAKRSSSGIESETSEFDKSCPDLWKSALI
jgi:hypothetical protein